MDTSINLVENLSKTLLEGLYTVSKYSDVTLMIGTVKFPVHRSILAIQSKFFHKLFYDNKFKEANEVKMKIDAPLDAFESVLTFMYSGKLDFGEKDSADLLEILELSRRYALVKLERALVDKLCTMVQFDNVAIMTKAGEIIDADKLTEKCFDLLQQRGNKYLESEAFMKLNEQELVYICSHRCFKATTIKKFEAIVKWLKLHPNCSTTDKILSCINLSMLSNAQLTKTVRPTLLFSDAKLFDVMESRDKDVSEEIDCFSSPQGTSVVVGRGSKNICNVEEFILAERLNNKWELIVDLGEIYTFNHLQFDINPDNIEALVEIFFSDEYSVGYSPDKAIWKFLIGFANKLVKQCFYFYPITARFIRIQGSSVCKGLKVMNLPLASKIVMSLCPNVDMCPKDKIPEPGKNVYAALCQEFDGSEKFLDTKNLVMRLSTIQPIRRCRLLLWDVDGLKQNISFQANLSSGYQDQKTLNNVNGWQMFDLNATYNYDGFTFGTAGPRLTHFEVCNFVPEAIVENV